MIKGKDIRRGKKAEVVKPLNVMDIGRRKSDHKLFVDFGRCRKKQLVEITTTATTKGEMEKGKVILTFDPVREIKNDQVDRRPLTTRQNRIRPKKKKK